MKDQQLKLTIPVKGDLTSMFGLTVDGDPPMKPVSEYTIIGKSFPNSIITFESDCEGNVGHRCAVAGNVAWRVVHPKTLGSTLVSAGTLDKTKFPNSQVIVKGNLVGVVAPTEWEAIKASEQVAERDEVERVEGTAGERKTF